MARPPFAGEFFRRRHEAPNLTRFYFSVERKNGLKTWHKFSGISIDYGESCARPVLARSNVESRAGHYSVRRRSYFAERIDPMARTQGYPVRAGAEAAATSQQTGEHDPRGRYAALSRL